MKLTMLSAIRITWQRKQPQHLISKEDHRDSWLTTRTTLTLDLDTGQHSLFNGEEDNLNASKWDKEAWQGRIEWRVTNFRVPFNNVLLAWVTTNIGKIGSIWRKGTLKGHLGRGFWKSGTFYAGTWKEGHFGQHPYRDSLLTTSTLDLGRGNINSLSAKRTTSTLEWRSGLSWWTSWSLDWTSRVSIFFSKEFCQNDTKIVHVIDSVLLTN